LELSYKVKERLAKTGRSAHLKIITKWELPLPSRCLVFHGEHERIVLVKF